MKRKNDENCVVANMFTVFWFNKQNEFEILISSPSPFKEEERNSTRREWGSHGGGRQI
jgi:hypothetical protein